MNTQVLEARLEFIDQPFLTPMQLSTGPINEVTEARVTVKVRVDGKEGVGVGVILLSDLWSWPDPALSHAHRDMKMRELCGEIAELLPSLCGEAAHPLEHGICLHDWGHHLSSPLPLLARSVCISPFDAAIHDAAGQALNRSAFSFYEELRLLPSVDSFFACGNAFEAIRRCLKEPVEALDAWWIAGAGDQLPESLEAAICSGGYRAFKIKLLTKNLAEDVARIIEVYDAARSLGLEKPRLSLDSNEGNKSTEEVKAFLLALRQDRSEVFDAIEYLEQPTSRDIVSVPTDWSEVSKLKPVLLDEGLTDLSLLPTAREQAWSGFALKTCKGHSFALLAAAWAYERGLPVAMQDLTNPGYAAIHSFLFAAHLRTMNGIELNSPQYIPSANEAWLPRQSSLFSVIDGKHRLACEKIIGLGSNL